MFCQEQELDLENVVSSTPVQPPATLSVLNFTTLPIPVHSENDSRVFFLIVLLLLAILLGFPLSWLQRIPGLPGPCHKPAMFKYSDKRQTGRSGEHCKPPLRCPEKSLSHKSIFVIPAAQKTYLVATIMAIFVCRNMSI